MLTRYRKRDFFIKRTLKYKLLLRLFRLSPARIIMCEAIDMLETCELVLGGSFLQTMARKKLQRRNAENGTVPNGQTDTDTPPERVRFTPRRR